MPSCAATIEPFKAQAAVPPSTRRLGEAQRHHHLQLDVPVVDDLPVGRVVAFVDLAEEMANLSGRCLVGEVWRDELGRHERWHDVADEVDG